MEHDTVSFSDSEERAVDFGYRALLAYDSNSDDSSESSEEVSKRIECLVSY